MRVKASCPDRRSCPIRLAYQTGPLRSEAVSAVILLGEEAWTSIPWRQAEKDGLNFQALKVQRVISLWKSEEVCRIWEADSGASAVMVNACVDNTCYFILYLVRKFCGLFLPISLTAVWWLAACEPKCFMVPRLYFSCQARSNRPKTQKADQRKE